MGGFFGIVVGKPIARSDRWRFGFGFTSPVAWAPSSLDGAFSLPVGDATEAFGYSTEVNFNTVIPSLNAAYRLSPKVRVGVGAGYGMTDLSQTQTLKDRLVSATGVVTGIRAFSTDGSVHHLLLTGGVQWDLARAITVGATVAPPGLRIGGSSKIRFSQTLFQSDGTQDDLSFRDPEANLDYKMPVRATAGATFRYSRGQVELDVRYYGAQDQYELLSSDSTAVRITTDAGGTPTITAPAFTAGPARGALHRQLCPGCQLLALPVAAAPRRRLHRSVARERTVAVHLPRREPHRSLGRDLARLGQAHGVGRRFQLVGNDHGPGGRPDPGRDPGDHRREHPHLYRALRRLVHVLKGPPTHTGRSCTKVQWSEHSRRAMVDPARPSAQPTTPIPPVEDTCSAFPLSAP